MNTKTLFCVKCCVLFNNNARLNICTTMCSTKITLYFGVTKKIIFIIALQQEWAAVKGNKHATIRIYSEYNSLYEQLI